jgi:hypothetical protein
MYKSRPQRGRYAKNNPEIGEVPIEGAEDKNVPHSSPEEAVDKIADTASEDSE